MATFTVTDRDQDIPDHDFAISKVEIISVKNADDADDAKNATLSNHDGVAATPDTLGIAGWSSENSTVVNEGYAAAFRLSKPMKSGNTWTYHIYTRDTDTNPFTSTLTQLNHEAVDEIEIEVRVTDGTGATETAKIDVDIEDANEKPFAPSTFISTANRTVNQTETQKVMLHIKLYDVWSDDRDDDDDLTYGATTDASWIKVKSLGEWGDIKKGPDGETGGGDDLTWGTTTEANNRTIGTTSGDPADGDSRWRSSRSTASRARTRATAAPSSRSRPPTRTARRAAGSYTINVTDQNVSCRTPAR